jgi:membrane peptidoglycan carboxypeptidase
MGNPKRVDAAASSTSKTPKTGSPKGKRNPWLRAGLWTLVGILSVALVGTGVIAYAYSTTKLPDPNSDFRTNTSFVYYNDGKTPIGSFQVQNRVTLTYDQMPQTVKDAIVAAENRTFWTDPGISVTGLFRAALGLVGITPADATASGGGSTITQQFIKIMYLTQERSFSRKFTEILLAAKMGQTMTKEQILEGYLNTVYFGRGAYGVEAASQAYFKKPVSKLSLAEATALCDIANSPGNLDPTKGDKQASDLLERYQYTLNGLVEMGKITPSEKAAIYGALPEFQPEDTDQRMGGQKGFLLTMVRNELIAKGFTDQQISGGGLKVITTFDQNAQDAAVKVAQEQTLRASGGDKKKAQNLHGAISSIDNATGGVIAMYAGNPDFVKDSRNWATTPRETGSTFKTYALTAALREGWTLSDQVSRQTIRHGKAGYLPNPGGKKVDLQSATTNSIDPAYFNLVSQLKGGGDAVALAANDAGVPTFSDWHNDAYMPLGTPSVSPTDQASGYSTFANLGVHRPWHVVAEVWDTKVENTVQGTKSDPVQLYAADTTGVQGIEPDIAQDVTYALTQVVRSGTGYRAGSVGYPVAGKTGTKGQPNPNGPGRQTVATWFVGYTKQITTAVMYVKGKTGHEDLGASWYGGGAATQTWASYMRLAMKGLPRESFLGPTKRKSTMTPSPDTTPTPSNYPSWTPNPSYTPTTEAPTHPPTSSAPTATATDPPTSTASSTP